MLSEFMNLLRKFYFMRATARSTRVGMLFFDRLKNAPQNCGAFSIKLILYRADSCTNRVVPRQVIAYFIMSLSWAALATRPDSASSQFFIVQQDSTYLDGQYACFGYVTKGMDVVDEICDNTPVEDDNGTVKTENQPVIESIKIID